MKTRRKIVPMASPENTERFTLVLDTMYMLLYSTGMFQCEEYNMTSVSISNFRKNIFTYVNQALDFNTPVSVVTKNGNVVVLSEDEYSGLQETLYLLGAPEMREKLLEGMNAARGDLVEIDWRERLK